MTYYSEFAPKIWYCRQEFFEQSFADSHKNIGSIIGGVSEYKMESYSSILSGFRHQEMDKYFIEERKQNSLQKDQMARWNKDVIVNQDKP